jgi:hypothetical protein
MDVDHELESPNAGHVVQSECLSPPTSHMDVDHDLEAPNTRQVAQSEFLSPPVAPPGIAGSIKIRVYRHRKDWHHTFQCDFPREDDGGLDLQKLKVHLQAEGHCEVNIPPVPMGVLHRTDRVEDH